MVPVFSHMYPDPIFISYFFKTDLNIILLSFHLLLYLPLGGKTFCSSILLNTFIWQFLFQTLRIQLNLLRAYLFTCREPVIEELQKRVWPREYLYEHVHLYSVAVRMNHFRIIDTLILFAYLTSDLFPLNSNCKIYLNKTTVRPSFWAYERRQKLEVLIQKYSHSFKLFFIWGVIVGKFW
jgi:hypothetical protein